MPDKTPHQQQQKKAGKTIKQKRADKKAKGPIEGAPDPVAHLKKRLSCRITSKQEAGPVSGPAFLFALMAG